MRSPSKSGLYDGLFLYDLNDDQKADILAANYSLEIGRPGGINIWLYKSMGDWSENIGPISYGRFANITVADFNLDHTPDIAGTSWGPDGQLIVWLGRKGLQNWATMPPIDQGDFFSVKAADLNNDGTPDLIASIYQKGVRIYYGDGGGLFSPSQSLIQNGYFWDILVHDLNRDGWPDILASSFDNKGIFVWLNAGEGKRHEWMSEKGRAKVRGRVWKPVYRLLPNFGSYYDMLLDDFNHDEYIDLATAQKGQGVKIWLNFMNTEQIAGSNREFQGKTGEIASAEKGTELLSEVSGDSASHDDDAEKAALFESASNDHMPKKYSSQEIFANKIKKDKENQVYRIIDDVPEYIIGPGDTVEITFWEGMDSRVYTIPVRSNGTITTPFFEDFKIGGLTAVEADKILTKKMKRFMHNPQIDIRTIKFNSKRATILGAVDRPGPDRGPGTYYLTGKTTVLELVARAGGPGPDADLKRVELIQKGVTQKVNLYKAIFHADLNQNIVLDKDDVIYIPRISDTASKVYIFGEVKSPGIYPFSGSLTLLDVIAQAGGYSKDARLDSVKVVRGNISDPDVISCNLGEIIKKGNMMKNVQLLNNDLVYIPKSKIANMKLFVEKIDSLLKLVLYPVALVNTMKHPEDLELRLDIGY
jgi:polysaccharide export outer membrane protein